MKRDELAGYKTESVWLILNKEKEVFQGLESLFLCVPTVGVYVCARRHLFVICQHNRKDLLYELIQVWLIILQ